MRPGKGWAGAGLAGLGWSHCLARRVARSCSAFLGLGGDVAGWPPDGRQVFSVPGLGFVAQQKEVGIASCPVPR